MAIVSFSKDTIIDYVPEYGENRQSSDPCIISLRVVSFGQAREQQKVLAAKIKGADTQEKMMAISQALQKEQFVRHIESIKGYSVDDRAVTDIEEFYLTAPAEIIAEVLDAMQDSYKLSKGQSKNFERASVGAS